MKKLRMKTVDFRLQKNQGPKWQKDKINNRTIIKTNNRKDVGTNRTKTGTNNKRDLVEVVTNKIKKVMSQDSMLSYKRQLKRL